MRVEFWLCKVVLHPGPMRTPLRAHELTEHSHAAVLAKVIEGELGVLPDGCIVEPVTSHPTELLALEARERAMVDKPNDDWRVVLNAAVS